MAALIEGGVKKPDGETVSRQDLFLESKVKDLVVSIPKYKAMKHKFKCQVLCLLKLR